MPATGKKYLQLKAQEIKELKSACQQGRTREKRHVLTSPVPKYPQAITFTTVLDLGMLPVGSA